MKSPLLRELSAQVVENLTGEASAWVRFPATSLFRDIVITSIVYDQHLGRKVTQLFIRRIKSADFNLNRMLMTSNTGSSKTLFLFSSIITKLHSMLCAMHLQYICKCQSSQSFFATMKIFWQCLCNLEIFLHCFWDANVILVLGCWSHNNLLPWSQMYCQLILTAVLSPVKKVFSHLLWAL